MSTPSADAQDVLKSAAKGALKGGAAGAVKGAAVGAVKTEGGQKAVITIVIVALVALLAIPLGIGSLILGGSVGVDMGDTYRSTQSAVASDIEKEKVAASMSATQGKNVPWQLHLALTEYDENTPVDVERLATELGKTKATSLGAGTVYVDGKGLMPGERPGEKEAAAEEKQRYVVALVAYGVAAPIAPKIYERALSWSMGQVSACSDMEQPVTALTLTNSDGSKLNLNEKQVGNAKKIITEGRKIVDISDDEIIIMLMAAMAESSLLMYANSSVPESLEFPHDAVGSDHDSVGFFQMRAHWGTWAELMTVSYQVKAFIGGSQGPNGGSPRGLWDIDGWDLMTKGEAAQRVEVSAHPDRYQNFEASMTEMLGKVGLTSCDGSKPIAGAGGHPLGSVDFLINSGYGGRESPGGIGSTNHKGIDFAVGCNAPIYSVADGTVIESGWNSGWGYTVVVDHGNGFATRSAHMPTGSPMPPVGQAVKGGEQIGTVGTSGNSTGCHLHFETTIDGEHHDPYVVLTEMGVELRWVE